MIPLQLMLTYRSVVPNWCPTGLRGSLRVKYRVCLNPTQFARTSRRPRPVRR
jgi:hypothetical protein